MINKCYIEKSSHFLSNFIESYNLFIRSYIDSAEPGHSVSTAIGTMGFRISGLIDGYVIATGDKIAYFQYDIGGFRRYVQAFLDLYQREAVLRKDMAEYSIKSIDIENMDPTIYHIRKLQPSVSMKVNTNGCVFELYAFIEMNFETQNP